MDQNWLIIGAWASVLGLIIGLVISKIRDKNNASQITRNAERLAKDIISKAKSEGENIKKNKIFQAKERFLELKSEHEKVILSRDKKMAESEKRTQDKESQISSELSKNKKIKKKL